MRKVVRAFSVFSVCCGFWATAHQPAQACSVCLAGDNFFAQLGEKTQMPRHLTFSLEEKYLTKENVLPDNQSGRERQREHRFALKAAYGLSWKVTFFSSLPVTHKTIRETENSVSHRERVLGLGDLEFSAVYNRELSFSSRRSINLALVGGVKVPTGRNRVERGGIIEEHLQPGTGTWDFTAGLLANRIGRKVSVYASTYFRRNGTNGRGYHYGNNFLYNLIGQYRFNTTWAVTAELNGRFADKDKISDAIEPHTGGWVTYLTPGIKYALTDAVGLAGSVQIPIHQDLFGVQDEDPVFTVGLAYDWR